MTVDVQEAQRIVRSDPGKDDKKVQEQEKAFEVLGKYYVEQKDAEKVRELVTTAREVTSGYAKSKTAKIIRSLVDAMGKIPDSVDIQIATINECVDWAIAENRSFLRQGLQVRLVALLSEKQSYTQAIKLIGDLLRELKKLDDKMMLVEVQLLEAKVYHALRNLPKARASLTSARTSANSIYCPPKTQAELDTVSGVLQAEDGDYKTAFSYFYEAFEGYAGQNDPRAVDVLRYLFLVKIMLNLTDDVDQLVANKTVKQYAGRDIDAMRAMASANRNRSLSEFDKVLAQYRDVLTADPFIRSHLSAMYDKMLQDNLVKVIEPYECVEIEHIAEELGLETRQIEEKLSLMILDKVFYGVLDQGNGWLYVYPEPSPDKTYELGLETVKHMSSVVDMLYEKASLIN
ncbi:putative 26S proteasome regulatory subunit rpn6 [Wickerhamiella sorbophila]|uniref:Putative 26S proteasome regulatory subunit rpn6 n=1 Tax=Wickerhamiella sorbophila TaxID=45607 RepID=A0A2T0FCW8_9ASCO|nr:putative 26S proteasome regulatory subunit rpn6 [Wickerhamiella sorbophila]PRT52815.1 putative 26S proteasome regulatory subunit rpn6 [Wickerhamiella sorbophila]